VKDHGDESRIYHFIADWSWLENRPSDMFTPVRAGCKGNYAFRPLSTYFRLRTMHTALVLSGTTEARTCRSEANMSGIYQLKPVQNGLVLIGWNDYVRLTFPPYLRDLEPTDSSYHSRVHDHF
jgi:hypothetical protein